MESGTASGIRGAAPAALSGGGVDTQAGRCAEAARGLLPWVAPSAAVACLLIGCATPDTGVGAEVVEREVAAQATARGLAPDGVACEGGLSGEAGKTTRCAVTIANNVYTVDVTTTGEGGEQDSHQVDVAALPVAGELFAERIAQRLSEQVGRAPDQVTCPRLFVPAAGLEVACELADSGETYDLAVTVTTVNGADFDYTVQVAPEPR